MTDDPKVYGPYLRTYKRGSPRRQVVLVYADGRRTSMSYARWLLQIKIGRDLLPFEDADHIDNNPLNDDPSNLQVLTKLQNILKSAKKAEVFGFDCPVCGNYTEKPARFVRHNAAQGKAGPFCGKKCSRQWQLRSRIPTAEETDSKPV